MDEVINSIIKRLKDERDSAEKRLNATDHSYYMARYGAQKGAFERAIYIVLEELENGRNNKID